MTAASTDERPVGGIYIAGADRSGTSLLAALLASHSRIAIPALGTNMWTFFAGQYGDLARPANVERCLRAMLAYKNVNQLDPDRVRIEAAFLAGPRTYARLFAVILDQYAARRARPRWGDKTSYVERYASEIMAADQTVRMVHVVRDPRDRYASAIRRWPKGRGQLGGATARWLYSMGLAERNARHFPDRYITVRYEDLVARPESTLRRLCAFLGEEYEPAMLDLSGAPGFRAKGGNSSFLDGRSGAISAASVGRFQSTIGVTEVAFIQRFARSRMAGQGYDVVATPLGVADRLRYGLRVLPVNTARLVAWRGLESAQQRLPALIGRSPMRARIVGGRPDEGDD